MTASADNLRVLSRIRGRIRMFVTGWTGDEVEWIENHLRRINGVESVQANPLTGNVLIHFDGGAIDDDTLVGKVKELLAKLPNREWSVSAGRLTRNQPAQGDLSPIRVVARGLLGHAVVDSLWFGAGFLGSAVGLPLAGLGPLHLLMDVAVWTMALAGEQDPVRTPTQKQAGQLHRPAGQSVCSA